MPKSLWCVLVITCLLLCGCLVERKQRGIDIDPLLLAQLQPGVSTKADVLRVLGTPSRKTVIQDHEGWVYDFSLEENRVLFLLLYAEQQKTTQEHSVTILFTGDRMYDYIFTD